MKFPTFRRIFKQDYPVDQQSLVEKLSITINNSFETIFNAFNKNISLTDNILCTVKTISVKVNASGVPTTSTSFSIDTTGNIKGISVIKAENTTDASVFPTSAPFISYTQNNTVITITQVAGIPANNSFNLTVICWG